MRKFNQSALAAFATLALAACGSSTDASEDAIADNVEVPSDDALAGTPDPVMDEAATLEAGEAAEMDAMEAADAAVEMVEEDAETAVE